MRIKRTKRSNIRPAWAKELILAPGITQACRHNILNLLLGSTIMHAHWPNLKRLG